MKTRVVLYGASGYTGRLLAEAAGGLDLVLAGRSAQKLAPLAEQLRRPFKVAAVDDPDGLVEAFADAAVVVNAAGPFPATAQPVLAACLKVGAHYLDVGGEGPVFEALHRYHEAARQAGILVMPGAGFVVAASDALAAHAAQRLPNARRLWIGFSRADPISRGSIASMLDLADSRVTVRQAGRLVAVPAGRLTHAFDFGAGEVLGMVAPWPDPFSAYLTTGVPHIGAYLEADAPTRAVYGAASMFAPAAHWPMLRPALDALAGAWPEGPTEAQREATPKVVVVEAEDAYRRRVIARLHTPNVYTFTRDCVVALVRRALAGEARPGYGTPAGVFGPDFVLALPGVRREDASPRSPR